MVDLEQALAQRNVLAKGSGQLPLSGGSGGGGRFVGPEEEDMILTGTYVGDATGGRTIVTGMTRPIKWLYIIRPGIFQASKNDTQAGNAYEVIAGAVGAGITFVGNNFAVDNDGTVNNAGATYHWVAFG